MRVLELFPTFQREAKLFLGFRCSILIIWKFIINSVTSILEISYQI